MTEVDSHSDSLKKEGNSMYYIYIYIKRTSLKTGFDAITYFFIAFLKGNKTWGKKAPQTISVFFINCVREKL